MPGGLRSPLAGGEGGPPLSLMDQIKARKAMGATAPAGGLSFLDQLKGGLPKKAAAAGGGGPMSFLSELKMKAQPAASESENVAPAGELLRLLFLTAFQTVYNSLF